MVLNRTVAGYNEGMNATLVDNWLPEWKKQFTGLVRQVLAVVKALDGEGKGGDGHERCFMLRTCHSTTPEAAPHFQPKFVEQMSDGIRDVARSEDLLLFEWGMFMAAFNANNRGNPRLTPYTMRDSGHQGDFVSLLLAHQILYHSGLFCFDT